MEGDFNLKSGGTGTGHRSRRTGKKALAILLSAVLAAGMCLPAYGAEAGEDTAEGINVAETAEAPAEEPAAEEPEEASEQKPGAEEPEDSMEEMASEQEEYPAVEKAGVPQEAVPEVSAEEEETAAGDRTAEAAEEIVEGEAEELMAGDTSGWLSDYSYSVESDRIKLEGYSGNDSEITVPGSAVVNGTQYNTVEISAGLWQDAESLAFDSGVVFPDNSSGLFRNMQDLQSIDLSNIDTSNVTDMCQMFDWCVQLAELDVSGFNTSKVTDMSDMFSGCSSLTSLDVTHFDTSKVTDMQGMFNACTGLTSLDLSSFDTSNVTNMYGMFSYCEMTSLDLSRFNTSKVTDMGDMFYGCINLSSLNVSSFDTSKVTYMSYMFSGCSSLSSLDISSFDMYAVGYCEDMLSDCTNLMTINTPKRLLKGVVLLFTYVDAAGTEYEELPRNKAASICLTRKANGTGEWLSDYTYSVESDRIKLESYSGNDSDITVPGSAVINGTQYNTVEISAGLWPNAESLTFENGVVFPDDSSGLFSYMYSLESIDLSNVDTSNVTNMRNMFLDCTNLTSLDLSSFDTSNVTDMGYMFWACYSLSSLDVSTFVTSKVIDMAGMFMECGGLSSLDVSGFNTSNVSSMFQMFQGCSGLSSLDVSGFDTGKVTSMEYMFIGCGNLTKLNLSSWDFSRAGNADYMFSSSLQEIKAPVGLSKDIALPAEYTGSNGVVYRSLPKNMQNSLILTKGVMETITISKQPVSVTTAAGKSITFSVEAASSSGGNLYYQWQYQGKSSTTWTNFANATGATMTKTASASWNGWKVRCVVTDSSGNTAVSDTATITIAEGISITTQPASVTSQAGQSVTFSITATGTGLTYQWQYQGRTSTKWNNFANATGASMTKTVQGSWDGWKVRCVVMDGSGNTAVSDTATITIGEGISITSQPASAIAQAGQSVTFSITATGTGLTYQWQYQGRTSTKWNNFANATGASMTKTVQGSWDGWKVRCAVIDDSGTIIYSDVATITIIEQVSGWLSDYEYEVQGDKIKLIGYTGGDTAIVVPGSAVVEGTEYDTVEISAGLWHDARSITFERGVVFPDDSSHLFEECYSLQSIDLSNVDTSNVTNMSFMFYSCGLTNLDVSGFDTGNVTDMLCMFWGCSSLKSLDLSGFDTGNVTDMGSMFVGNYNLTNLDVSGFDTGNVTDMSYMFSNCESLASLDLSGFDTGNVTDMGCMFDDCSSLTNLDVSSFDTGNVTKMIFMFKGCDNLTSLDLSGFDTKNVTDMFYMFYGCESLKSLDLSKFDTGNVTDMSSMFERCVSLKSLNLSGFDTGNVTDMSYMFSYCGELTSLNLSGFDFSNVNLSDCMFYDCSALMEINAPGAVTRAIALPGTYVGTDGVYYRYLPKRNSTPMLLLWAGSETGDFYIGSGSGNPYSGSGSGNPSTSEVPCITTGPEDVTAPAGTAVSFSIQAKGSGLTYQWQYQGSSSTKWTNFTNATNPAITKTVQSSWNGWKVRCFVTDEDGDVVVSDTALVTVGAPGTNT